MAGLGIGLGLGFWRGAGGAPPPELPTTGLISEWRFAEGSGTTVADQVGSNTINLNLPTTPNYTWASTGVDLAAGLVQTPSITSARTVVLLYKTTRDQTAGYLISGGPAGSGGGVLENSVSTTYQHHVGFGAGVRPLRYRTSSGVNAFALNRGGWVLAICQFNSASTTALGFGGRHSTTTSRCANISIAWAAVYNTTLDDAGRAAVFEYVAYLAKQRGIYLRTADAPTQANGVLLWGQSNAEGRALISGLSAGDQARTYTKTYIEAQTSATRGTPPPALLALGTNQTLTSPSTQFGPEIGLAMDYEDAAHARNLYICKTASSSLFLAPSSLGAPVTTTTWSSAELPTNGTYHPALTRDWYDIEQQALLSGVGVNLRALLWMQGEQDATSTVAAPDSATHQSYLQALYDDLKTHTAYASLPMIVGRIRDQDPAMNATAKAAVRAGQAAFVSANSGCVLIDTDAMSLGADNLHYDAAGMKALGQAFHDAGAWT